MKRILGHAVGALCIVAMLALVWSAVVAQGGDHSVETLKCSECHACEQPSHSNPCLIPKSCPRHEAMIGLDADLGPSVVILDELENLYVPVRFDHLAHAKMVDMSGGCETCHHLTPPNSEHPACKECHPVEIVHEDLSQPGLKGAYHRSCMGCHTEWDSDTACEICHEKKSRSSPTPTTDITIHSHYERIEMAELITFTTEFEEGEQVPFHHKNHATEYGIECSDCHTQQSCERCHVHGEDSHPMGAISEIDLHNTCFSCHTEEPCGKCHGIDPTGPFRHATTGWPLKSYHAQLACKQCHAGGRATTKLNPACESCHRTDWPASFKHAVTGVELDEMHGDLDCVDCHTQGVGNGTHCSDCHDDDRRYDKTTGFGS